MANRLKMADINAIRALLGKGWSHRKVSRELGINRETVGRYARIAAESGSNPAKVAAGSVDSAAKSKPATGGHFGWFWVAGDTSVSAGCSSITNALRRPSPNPLPTSTPPPLLSSDS